MSMNKATEEAVEQNGGSKDLTVVYDGIWQKRGYKSTNGVCTLTSLETGKIIDVEVLTKFYSGCVKYKGDTVKTDIHKSRCIKNYEGASGGMETCATIKRSEEKRGVRYEYFLGDGDSKAHIAVVDSNPHIMIWK